MRSLSLLVPLFLSANMSIAVAQDTIQAGDPRVDPALFARDAHDVEFFGRRGGDLIRRGAYSVRTEEFTYRGEAALLLELQIAGRLIDSSIAWRSDLTPIAHRSHSPVRNMFLDFDGSRVTGEVVPGNGTGTRVDDAAAYRPFDSSAMPQVISSLPLADGFHAVIPFYIRERGGLVWHDVTVTGRMRVPDPTGLPVSAWRIEARPGSGEPTIYYVATVDRALLRSEFGTSFVMLPVRQQQTPAARELAVKWLGEAIDAIGGDRLRSIDAMRTEHIGYSNAIEQSERPEGPWIKIYEQVSEVRDLRNIRIRRTTSLRSGPWSPEWSAPLTYVADETAGSVTRGERSGPLSPNQQQQLIDDVRLAPERILFTALEAPDLVAIGDTVAAGSPQMRVQFTLGDRRVQLLIDENTMVPHGWAAWGPSTRGFDGMWGSSITLVTTWYAWNLHDNGVLYPGARHVDWNGVPLGDVTFTSVAFEIPALDDSLRIGDDIRTAFGTMTAPTPTSIAFGTSFNGEPQDPVELAPGVTVFPGTWNVTAVELDEGVVVIEAPISSYYSVQAIETIGRRTGKPIIGVVTTSDAWPHFAGVREYVARGIPVYHLDLNAPIIERLLGARYASEPDSLELSMTRPDLHPVSTTLAIGSGLNRMEMYPVRGEGGERMMLVYLPERRALYASDLVQLTPDGTFWAPEYLAEVARVVEREGLTVETVFAMHTTPIPWSRVESALP